MKILRVVFLLLFVFAIQLVAQPAARILSQHGCVLVRPGLSESWQEAKVGMALESFDTILTTEDSEVLIQTQDGGRLRIGANIILDISDIKRLSEREMFLWLVSQKIEQLPKRQDKTPLRFGQITSVHGEEKTAQTALAAERPRRWRAEVNGAATLLENAFNTNTIVKCHKILRHYPEQNDCGEIHFYLGRAFEAIHHTGQALAAYQQALQRLEVQGCGAQTHSGRRQEIETAVARLKQSRMIQ